MRIGIVLALVLYGSGSFVAAAPPAVRTGSIEYKPAADEKDIPERFRLESHRFDFEQKPVETAATAMEMFEVTFPSPVVTPHPNNNTVHAEYFRPADAASGPHPGVIVLHILGGDFDLSRVFCRTLAHNGVCALFIKLPYYGPRAQPGVSMRMVSVDPRETVAGMTQAVLDIRRGRAWLAAQSEVDPQRTGIFGISLGGITSALAATAEPRFSKVCLMLAGGDIARVSWQARELSGIRERWMAQGGTQQSFFEVLQPIDPVTYAGNLRGRPILMLNARHDEVVPPECTEALWKACGEPEIHWFDAGHYSIGRFMFDGLSTVTQFFQK